MPKLLREKYKTYEGAQKRTAFENAIAKSEYEHGHKARLYRYTIVRENDDVGNDQYRVQRNWSL